MGVKILDIVWYKIIPARFGGQKGIEGFLTALSTHCEVVVLCSNNNKPSGNEPYKVLPLLPTGKLQFINVAKWRLIKKVCVAEGITHICIEHPYYSWGVRYVAKYLKLPVIIHSHNIESERFKTLGKWWWKRLWKYEGYAHRKADFNLFKTSDDMAYAVEQYRVPPDRCMVLPYCLIAHHRMYDKLQSSGIIRHRYAIPAANKILLFCGTLDYKPNATAVEKIYNEIAPLLFTISPNPISILICGRNELPAFSYLNQLKHPNVQQIGFVENIDEINAAADVFINPVTEGGGIQTKIIDALGQHTNVVSFTSGAGGINPHLAGNKLMVCKDGDYLQFVKLTIDLIDNKTLTPDIFFENFNWEFYKDQLMLKVLV